MLKLTSYMYCILFFILVVSSISKAQFATSKIHPELKTVLQNSSSDQMIDVYVMLKDRYSFQDITQKIFHLSKKGKQKEIVKTLRSFAKEKQKNILIYLENSKQLGKVSRIDILWATNTIVLSATEDIINSLSNFNEISQIMYDRKFNNGSDKISNGKASIDINVDINPGISLIRADDVWAEGYYGQGVFIASIDEDCNWDHPDLVHNIWNNLGEDADGDGHTIEQNGNEWILDPGDLNGIDDDGNGYIDDLIGWDFVENDNDFYGRDVSPQHGTKTAGIAVGDGTLGTKTGVAPQAKIVNLRIGENWQQQQTYCWLAEQYAINMGVDIITHSQSFHWDDGPPDVAMFRDMAVLELEAGIIHFTSISNDGLLVNGTDVPIPFNVSTPGDCPPPWLHPEQTLIGGTSSIMGIGNVVASSGLINSTSPYGPSSQEDYSINNYYPWVMPEKYWDYPFETVPGSMGLLKPDVSSPGAGTVSTEGMHGVYGYVDFNGTSSATPHAAGTAALLFSVNPSLTPVDICRILEESSIDKGDPGHDNRYGAGRIDAYAAYLQTIGELTDIKSIKYPELSDFYLFQNYPNPFNPSTIIRYSIPAESKVTIKLYNLLGQELKQLVNATESAGYHEITFNAGNLASGIYFYRTIAISTDGKKDFVDTKKLMLMK
jgi:subtilisin family serine protease